MSIDNVGVPLEFSGPVVTPAGARIRKLGDIPDIQLMDIPPRQWIVPGLIPRGSLTMWAGVPGAAKSYLNLSLAVAVAGGTDFLGRRCVQCPVLILDYENTAFEVQKRLALMTGETHVPNLYVWGLWNDDDPAKIGSDIIMAMAEESKPLIIFDPFRNAHACDENSSTEMTTIMQQLTYLKKLGATVVFLHHPGKGEGATSRGSSAIDGAVDLSLVQTLDPDSQRIELKCTKNKIGAPFHICIRADFEAGTFEATQSEAFVRMNADVQKLKDIIAQHPTGISQRGIVEIAGIKDARALTVLREGIGTSWGMQPGKGRSKIYFPLECFPNLGITSGIRESSGQQVRVIPVIPPVGGGNQGIITPESPAGAGSGDSRALRKNQLHGNHLGGPERPNGKATPRCPNCGSTVIVHNLCQVCHPATV